MSYDSYVQQMPPGYKTTKTANSTFKTIPVESLVPTALESVQESA